MLVGILNNQIVTALKSQRECLVVYRGNDARVDVVTIDMRDNNSFAACGEFLSSLTGVSIEESEAQAYLDEAARILGLRKYHKKLREFIDKIMLYFVGEITHGGKRR